ncbi:MAG: hypothetical protein IJ746_00295 [Ruminococcus sp.]|nr:hypothetical protein [Ruminococcus sp.]
MVHLLLALINVKTGAGGRVVEKLGALTDIL